MLSTLKNAWRIPDIRRKILYTLMIVLIFRIGSGIPVLFLDTNQIKAYIESQAAFGNLNLLTGNTLSSGSLFTLGISPYITSSIVIQLLAVAIPYLENLGKEGPEGKKKLDRITRYTALALALLQSVAYYILNRNMGSVKYTTGFAGTFAGLVIIASFTAGAMLVVWLGERIDAHGIGNGISMLLFAGIVSGAPAAIISVLQFFMAGGKYLVLVPMIILIFALMIIAIIVMNNAERRIPVQYAKRVVGRKMVGGQASFMPIKVLMSGVMPVIFAGSILSIPQMILAFTNPAPTSTLYKVLSVFNSTSVVYIVLYVFLIIAFNYFYVAIQYDPMEMANNLRKNNGTIPGIRPGQPTADFITRVISRITLFGAVFIAVIAVMPILGAKVSAIPISLGGTSIIIVVGVALDTVKELESMMMMRHYKGFLE